MVNQAIKVIIMKSIESSFTTDPVRGDIEGPVYDPDIEVIIMDSIEVSSTTDQIRGDIDCPFYDPDIEGIEGFLTADPGPTVYGGHRMSLSKSIHNTRCLP